MPRDKDLKRLVRTRMQKTGEAYTTARARITEKPAARKKAAPAPPAEVRPDYAATAGTSDVTIAAKTGRSWEQWVRILDQAGAEQLPHGEIARIVNGTYEVDGWWSQCVTVGYERIKGLRDRGQRRSGAYEASKSKTFNVPVDVLFDACAERKLRRRWLTDVDPVVRTATKPRSLRLGWPDGTIVVLGFLDKGEAKSAVAVQHTKLPDRAASDSFKKYWGERLGALGDLLSKR